MTLKPALLTALLAATPTLASAQQTPAPSSKPQQVSVDDLIEQLGDESFRARKAATRQLTERGSAALDDLRSAAEDHDDPEVRMRAGRILRRIERAAEEPAERVQRAPSQRGGVQRDEIRTLIDEVMRERFPDHGKWIERALRDASPGFDFKVDGDAASSSRKVSIQIGPDGVRVEVDSDEGGETKSKVYEAKDLETLRKEHPEIAKQYFGQGNAQPFGFRRFSRPDTLDIQPRDLDFGFRMELPEAVMPKDFAPFVVPMPGQAEAFEPDAASVPAEGRRLGVYVEDLNPAVAEFLGLEKGLKIASVETDTLAKDLGINSGDVLIRIGGKQIDSRADVASALGAIDKGSDVEVVVNRRGRELELRAKKRVSGQVKESRSDAEPPKSSDSPLKLRKRSKRNR